MTEVAFFSWSNDKTWQFGPLF